MSVGSPATLCPSLASIFHDVYSPNFKFIYHNAGKSIHLNAQNRYCLKCVLSHFPNDWLGVNFHAINLRPARCTKLLYFFFENSSAYKKNASRQNAIAQIKKANDKTTTFLIKKSNLFFFF